MGAGQTRSDGTKPLRRHVEKLWFQDHEFARAGVQTACRRAGRSFVELTAVRIVRPGAKRPTSAERVYRSRSCGLSFRITPADRYGSARHSRTLSYSQTMIIGVPKEIKQQENRVSLLPSAAYQLESGTVTACWWNGVAGVGSGYPDEDYEKAGATCSTSTRRIRAGGSDRQSKGAAAGGIPAAAARADFVHLPASGRESRPLTDALAKSGATCIAYETIEVNRRLPLLEPMSEIAGPHVDHRRRIFSGQTRGRVGRVAGRRAGRAARARSL